MLTREMEGGLSKGEKAEEGRKGKERGREGRREGGKIKGKTRVYGRIMPPFCGCS